MSQKFYGKYRATVTNNVDTEQRGRLQLTVPDVLGDAPSSWAEPCVPLAGPTGPAMGVYLVPPIGAGVWVEFEAGEPDRPIWVGCRFGGSGDVPSDAKNGLPTSPPIVMQTLGQHVFLMSDTPGPTGGIHLKISSGAEISINETGITISNGQGAEIKLSGPQVSINNGALDVT